jgi:two-component system, oxyanion-binding sensor
VIEVRLGIVPLTDCAVLAVAREKGFFRRHGIDAQLSREASWANVRDKVAAGALDGAQMLAGMPLAATAGIDAVARPLLTGLSLDLNGNAITVSNELWSRMVELDPEGMAVRPITAAPLRRVIEQQRVRGGPPITLGMVYPFATHHYELRYWLAAAGIDPEDDLRLTVVPPPRMVEAIERRGIDGFCVGEPWNSLAVDRGLGRILVTKYEIWNNSPEKVFAVRSDFAEQRPEVHRALLRALIEAAAWADAAEHRAELARILADAAYVGLPERVIAASLTGRLPFSSGGSPVEQPDFHVFHRYAASFPWISHACWLLVQMLRWGQVTAAIDIAAIARSVYRPDLHREAANDVGASTPSVDAKSEGVHAGRWTIPGSDGEPIVMGPDLFFDGRSFDPDDLMQYLSSFDVRSLRVSIDALAHDNA